MINKNQFHTQPKVLEYYRDPTKDEIKFGHGALHYREFEFDKCFDEKNNLILKAKVSDDNILYFCCGMEYYISKKAKCHIIQCD